MAMTAAVVAVSAGSAAYQAYNASQSKSEAIDEKGRMEKLAEKAQLEAQAKQDQEKAQIAQTNADADKADAANVLRLMQQRRRNSTNPSYTKGGTLLTGPQGLGNAPTSTAAKTLLGQ